jgi:RecA-family ATPase
MSAYALTLDEWLLRDLPRVEHIVRPWLIVGGIVMIYGPRGVSKTNIAMGLALAIAEGEPFLGHEVPRPRHVLYVDGEMQRELVQNRLRKFEAHTSRPRAHSRLHYLNYADVEGGIEDLGREGSSGTALIERELKICGAAVLVIDNKSSLLKGGDENSAESYQVFNDWLLSLRARGITTVLVHHSGKRRADGTLAQRGTSRVEDVMDTIIQLDRAGKPHEGTIPVTWTWEKFRSFTPDDPTFGLRVHYDDAEMLAWLELGLGEDGRGPEWLEAAQTLREGGMSYRDIAQTLGLQSYSTVRRWLDKEAA